LASKRNEKFLLTRLKSMYGEDFDPIIQIAENATRLQAAIMGKLESGDDDIELSALIEANKEWERMAQFTHPKLKSVEHTAEDGFFEVHIHKGGDK